MSRAQYLKRLALERMARANDGYPVGVTVALKVVVGSVSGLPSTGLSRGYSRTWRERNWPRPTGRGRAGVLLPGRVTSQPRSSGRSGSATAGAAHSWAKAAGAATSGPSLNFIIVSRM